MLAVAAGYISLLSAPVSAQAIVVNGVSCPTASVNFTLAGLVTILPASCSGNGNPCDSAVVTFSSTGISIQAPATCLTAPSVGSPMVLQTVSVNGNTCNTATVAYSAAGMAITAPVGCLAMPPPVITGISSASVFPGQYLTITGTNFSAGATATVGGVAAAVFGTPGATSLTVTVPSVATGSQSILVTVNGQTSAAFPVTVTSPPAVATVIAVTSRKAHGTAGTFDLAVETTASITGLVTVEPRVAGTGHIIVFQFDRPITSSGTPSAVNGNGASLSGVTALATGSTVEVTLPSVPDNSRATVTLSGVNSTVNVSASMGFLVGDVDNSRSVNASDISAVKSRTGQAANTTNFKFDVNASGDIGAADASATKARTGLVLP